MNLTDSKVVDYSTHDDDGILQATIENEEKIERCLKKLNDIGALREVNCFTFDPPMWLFNCAETIAEVAGLLPAHPDGTYKGVVQ